MQFNTMGVIPDSKLHGANMGPTWGRQVPGGPHVGPMNLAIRDDFKRSASVVVGSPRSWWRQSYICDVCFLSPPSLHKHGTVPDIKIWMTHNGNTVVSIAPVQNYRFSHKLYSGYYIQRHPREKANPLIQSVCRSPHLSRTLSVL